MQGYDVVSFRSINRIMIFEKKKFHERNKKNDKTNMLLIYMYMSFQITRWDQSLKDIKCFKSSPLNLDPHKS